MIKGISGKTLTVAVIILFIGVGVQPAIADTPNNSDREDDCNLCPKKVSKQHLVLIESLLNRLEKYDNILSVLSKYNPIVEKKYQEISDKIITDSEINIEMKTDWDFPVICGILGLIFFLQVLFIFYPMITILDLLNTLEFFNIYFILGFILFIFVIPFTIVWELGDLFYCDWVPYSAP